MDAVQSLVPQVHALSFAALPSLTAHAATFAQLSTDAKQNKPLDAVQSLVPHTQLPVFAALPSVTAHVGTQFNLAFSFGLYADDGQFWQALALTKGFNSGDAMYVPASQQPYRPLVPEDDGVGSFQLDGNARDHCPPHIVRLKPLPEKTGRRVKDPKKIGKKSKKNWKKKKMSENIRWQKQGPEAPRRAVDVLDCMMSVTFAVFQLERSELNTDA